MEKIRISQDIQFFINNLNRIKMISYKAFRYDKKHKYYESYNKYEKIKLGVQLCDFLNTNFSSSENAEEFIDKYSIITISGLVNADLYTYYEENEYEETIKTIITKVVPTLEKYKKAFIEDIKYIYNLNNLEELHDLTPAQRLYILKNSKKESNVIKLYDSKDLKLDFNNFGSNINFAIDYEENAQEIAKYVEDDKLTPYSFRCSNIIQSFIVEFLELANTENIEIKQCKNCGKYFVPDNRSDEIYCSNIYENGKTCKEVGHFRTQQRLMKEDDDLRIYRNVYQKLLLRTRRNPDNSQYEKEFREFKEKNVELKEKINNGKITQEEYMKWLNEQ